MRQRGDVLACELTYHLLGDVNFLENGHGTLLKRALDIDLYI
jgi:hypothetical protein